MEYLFICHPRCSTCKKAQKWLDDNNISYQVRDITQYGPAEEELHEWIPASRLPAKRFFNTSGQLYRSLELKDRLAAMSEGEMIEHLAVDGMLVKRPLLIGENVVLVGFREAEWEQRLLHSEGS